jgi:hypothetical protein
MVALEPKAESAVRVARAGTSRLRRLHEASGLGVRPLSVACLDHMRHQRVASAWAGAGVIAIAQLGCGGRSEDCDPQQVGCEGSESEPPITLYAPAPSPGSPPAATASGTVVPTPASPLPDWPAPVPDDTPPAPAEPGTSAVGAACPLPIEKLQPRGCFLASPYYADAATDCSDVWCRALAADPVSVCSPIAPVFGGGYHYPVTAAGVTLDVFFTPYPLDPSDPTPRKEDLGFIRVHYDLGLSDGVGFPVSGDAYLEGQEAFDAGLDLVDGTLFGTLTLDPHAPNVRGPLYHPSCERGLDELGNDVPGPCACVFQSTLMTLPIHVRLGPLQLP